MRRVAALILEGVPQKEMATRLGIALRTVKAKSNCLYRNLRLDRQNELPHVVFIREHRAEIEYSGPSAAELNQKQLEMVRLVAAGLNNRALGQVIGTTEMTVKNYLRVIYDLVGLDNRAELALWYWAHFPE